MYPIFDALTGGDISLQIDLYAENQPANRTTLNQERPKGDLIHVGVILYFGSKKINLFPGSPEV